jgi:23S rRNA (uracil747-C5)-methyltransferase
VVASRLYATARDWVRQLPVNHMWDLFCGVGGFGLHCATPEMRLTGIEIAPEAIACAKQSAASSGCIICIFRRSIPRSLPPAKARFPIWCW